MSSIFIQAPNPDAPCSCQDCDWRGPASALQMVSSIEERICAGEIVPAGECPACGALASLDRPEVMPAVGEIAISREFLQWLVRAADATVEEWTSSVRDGADDLQGDLDKVNEAAAAAQALLVAAPTEAEDGQ